MLLWSRLTLLTLRLVMEWIGIYFSLSVGAQEVLIDPGTVKPTSSADLSLNLLLIWNQLIFFSFISPVLIVLQSCFPSRCTLFSFEATSFVSFMTSLLFQPRYLYPLSSHLQLFWKSHNHIRKNTFSYRFELICISLMKKQLQVKVYRQLCVF